MVFFFGKKVFKYSVRYKDGKKFRPFCVMLPKMDAYRRDFDETKFISFFDKKLSIAKKV